MDADRIDPQRHRLRESAAQKPPAQMTGEEKREMRALRTAQRAFQKQYCPSCARYDPRTRDFIRKGHQNDAADCFWHWTDIVGECWNYRKRPEPWYEAIEAYCAARTEAYWRAMRVVAHFIASVMDRVSRR